MDIIIASQLAGELVNLLSPACVQIEVAGSVRRCKSEVKDIEIVCEPRYATNLDMFGDIIKIAQNFGSHLDAIINTLLGVYRGTLKKNGEKYKQLALTYPHSINLDFFIVTPPASWGVIFTIRTGPASFSQRLVTSTRYGGCMPPGWKVQGGALWHDQDIVPTPTERSLFDAIGLDWIEPMSRS